ncbi:MAG: histone deacetylase [Planctomycetota bacterium]
MKLPVFYHPDYAAPIGDDHTMPIRKFGLVAEALRRDDTLAVGFREPTPITDAQLRSAHTPDYIEAVRTGHPRGLAESQKFPWTPPLFGSVKLTAAGMLDACRAALDPQNEHRAAAALVSGFHHAHADHGEGFCTFNGLAIAADALRDESQAERIAVLDLDLHYGNGTASLCAARPHLANLSIYGNDYRENTPYRDVSIKRHKDGPNHRGVALPNGADGDHLLTVLNAELPWLLTCFDGQPPDALIYQAGADPLRDDPYSPLDLGHSDLRTRDAFVFDFARRHGLPVAWNLAGGYTKDVSQVVDAHVNTFRAFFETRDSSPEVAPD